MKLLPCVVMLLGSVVAKSQQVVIPPSPTARSFDKFVNYDVSIQNGMPSITVPLFSLSVGNTVIPVELKYHASGIKYGQAAGEVGLGWVLDPGYRVSRTINGRPDEYYVKPVVPSYFATNQQRDQFLSNHISRGSADDPGIPAPSGYHDGEFDLFTYRLSQHSGQFIIEDRSLNKLREISPSQIAISMTRGSSNSISHFDVKDGNGIGYRFGKSLQTGAASTETNPVGSGYGASPASWLLTDINDPLGNYARFEYAKYSDVESRSQNSFRIFQGATTNTNPVPTSVGLTTQPGTVIYSDVARVQKITTNNEIIEFTRSGTNGQLTSLLIKNANGQRIRKINFYYSVPFLDRVEIFGSSDAASPEIYAFDYFNKGQNLTFMPDYWGYNMLGSSSNHFPDFGLVQYTDGFNFSTTKDAYNDGLIGVNRNPVVAPVYYSLSKITYPTGGYTEYEYEANKFLGYRDDLNQVGEKLVGLRIKKISSFDGVSTTLNREYKYGNNESGYGAPVADFANRNYFANEGVVLYPTQGTSTDGLRESIFSSNISPEVSGGGFIGSPVHYDKVTEYATDLSASSNGKTEYIFSAAAEVSWAGFSNNQFYEIHSGSGAPAMLSRQYYQYYISNYQLWNKGQLISKIDYARTGNTFQKVRQEDYHYQDNFLGQVEGLKVRSFAKMSNSYSNQLAYSTGITSLFDYSPYSISFGNKLMDTKTTTNYDGTQEIVTTVLYTYNSRYQIASEKSQTSKGDAVTKTLRYPSDFGTITSVDDVSKGVKLLLDNNILNTPIEQTTTLRKPSGTTDYLVQSVYNVFYPTRPLLKTAMDMETDGSITDFSIASNSGGQVVSDLRYKPSAEFILYDATGNLLEHRKAHDVTYSYVWGYNKQYPVAQIVGASYADISGFINQSVLDNPASTEAQIRSEVNNIRVGLQNAGTKALVTGYTYSPLIGMTSQTDAKGITTYYEYDSFGRLSVVRDQFQNIIKVHSYKFAGQ